MKNKRSYNIRKHWSQKAIRWGWIDKLHILDLQIQNHSKFVLHLFFQINLGRWIEASMCTSTWTRSKLRSGYDFCESGEFQVLKVCQRLWCWQIMKMKNNLHFFQKLKRATTLAPPSYVVPFGSQFIPSSLNLN